jgi:hypothetical protein
LTEVARVRRKSEFGFARSRIRPAVRMSYGYSPPPSARPMFLNGIPQILAHSVVINGQLDIVNIIRNHTDGGATAFSGDVTITPHGHSKDDLEGGSALFS